ncbi:MAG: hypothetical protein FWE28_02585 [Oscillospiraceae bacterium]|nr:hypothetical protein [Oscillospiraceae bacterium]
MHDKLVECLTNPIKNKLLLETIHQGRTTAKALAEKNKSIPQATLYRYLKKMVSDGVLKVVEERKVRNVTEKIYAPAIDVQADLERLIAENSGEAYLGLFQQFTIGLLNEFKTYAEREGIDLLNDGSGFRVRPFYATLDELKELAEKIHELIRPYAEHEMTSARKARSVAIIFTPPTAES